MYRCTAIETKQYRYHSHTSECEWNVNTVVIDVMEKSIVRARMSQTAVSCPTGQVGAVRSKSKIL
jgi:hypothetical protein